MDRVPRSAVYVNDETELAAEYQYPTSDQFALSGSSGLAERSCWTLDGILGTCGSIRDCYPNIRLPESSVADQWIIGARGGCNYAKSSGKQVILIERI